MLDKNLVRDVLAAALSTGGSFAELFAEDHNRNSITIANSVVQRVQSGIDYGAGLRVFNGFNYVYAYTNDTSRENLLKVGKETAAAVKKEACTAIKKFHILDFDKAHLYKIPFSASSKKRVVDLLKESNDAAIKYNALVKEAISSYTDSTQNVLIANSEGLWAEDTRYRTRVLLMAVASRVNEKQTGVSRRGAHSGFEYYDNIDIPEIGRSAAETAVTMLNAELCPGGKMPVIVGNAFGGVIFHEACGHSLEASYITRGTSAFYGKLGKKSRMKKSRL